MHKKRPPGKQPEVREQSALGGTGSRRRVPLAADGWRGVGGSSRVRVLPNQACLKLAGGVLGMNDKSDGHFETTNEVSSTKRKK